MFSCELEFLIPLCFLSVGKIYSRVKDFKSVSNQLLIMLASQLKNLWDRIML